MISAAVLVVSTGAAYADTSSKPYIKAYGGDVMTGGWFSSGNNCSTDASSNYQDPSFAAPGFTTDTRNGGILTYSKTSGTSSGGDSSQFAAFAIGEVDGRRVGDGFYSAGAQAARGSTSVKALTFANTGAYPFGGAAEGSVRQSNCIADYYSKKPSGATAISNLSQAIGLGSGDYSATAAAGSTFALTNGTASHTIPAGQRVTIYVNGDVYIDGNIVYDPAATVDNVPKFALIVKGSIYIDKSVTELDGMYVAEPAGATTAAITNDDGIIWTCHPNSTTTLAYTYPPNCNSTLVVNGALIGKQIDFLRVNGDISSASTAEDALGTVNSCASGSCNLSEVVNYSPALIMGGDFFTSTSTSTSGGLPIDSIISLPPVF